MDMQALYKKLTSQASKSSLSLKTTPQSHVQAMPKLFPSSSVTKFPCLSQCVANSWQKQKASPRLKPSKITFVLVNKSAKEIPGAGI